MTVLSVDSLVKQYGGRKVVNDVSLTVGSGTVVGLLGPNGAGKTTTFYLVVGMVRPDKGQVRIGSEDLTGDPMHIRARKGIGYLPQETSIFRKLTVRDNILAILEMLPVNRHERRARSEMLLEELGIAHLAGQRAAVLSGGEKRRLEISRTLAIDPAF
ncbi:MAG: ATP-binding cassette domain-containing protein, partial [Desulfobacterales bacterium]|nr:ATP-binding cassette domain-containing protein [Desulfobacterales bacterium]